ncbi:MAG: ATP-dependent helicase [Thermoplasmata archaeon]|nr:ATP-dependent helicase [Thermoplasmata archaeon]
MIRWAVDKRTKGEILAALDPLVAEWFDSRFAELTEPQSMAIPLIEAKKNVLVSSPTGSGKTLTAFLSIIDRLYKLQKSGELEDRIYAVYVSPLKALANDINKNLLAPIEELSELAVSKGEEELRIRVAVRTGDTSSGERQRQATKPPHIFITTPESLALVLSTPKFRKKFGKVEYVIVDEIHEICDSKRGVALSLNLERLQAECPSEIARIGLSATQAPIEEIGKFLVGHSGTDWRDLIIAEVKGQKDLDLNVLCPADDMTALPFEIVNSKMYDLLIDLISKHRTTLVFTNTRSGTEHVVFKLKERGLADIEAHHGSMSKESRFSVEDMLKEGKLKSVVSSTSLELGIDIGYIDLVCQIGSPKSVAKALQRIGRSGHEVGKTSQGRLIVFDNDDLVECAVLCRAAHKKHIDRVTIPSGCKDVLSQTIVGMSLEKKWRIEDAFAVVRRSYCYRELTREQFMDVLRFLSAKEGFEGVYSKIWLDEAEGVFGMKKSSRLIYYLNQGTIPEESSYKVFSEKGAPVGNLSEKFIERLSRGDIFVLGGKSYEFIKTQGMKVFVRHALGRKPTVPSWTGEMLPRSFDLSVEIGKFRDEISERLQALNDQENLDWLQRDFDVDIGSARTILNYFKEQQAVAGVPTNSRLLIEGYQDEESKSNIVFHFPFGRRVNDALSRAYAFKISNKYGFNTTVSVTDDCFMITTPTSIPLEEIQPLVKSDEIEILLRDSLKDTELLAQRFRHCASRALMILKNYRGKDLSLSRQQMRAKKLLETLEDAKNFPVVAEAYSEILNEVFDLDNAKEVLRSVESGDRTIAVSNYGDAPSPFSHNVLLAGISDVVLMEDRSSLLRQLHRKVLAKVLGQEALAEYKFEEEKVSLYFAKKINQVSSEDDLVELLRRTGPLQLFREKGLSATSLTGLPVETIRAMSEKLLKKGCIRSVWLSDSHWVISEDRDEISIALETEGEMPEIAKRLINFLQSPRSLPEITDNLSLSNEEATELLHVLERRFLAERISFSRNSFKWISCKPDYGDREESRAKMIERHLRMFAPLTLDEIAYHFRLAEQDAKTALSKLEYEGKAVSGRFVIGDDIQYMLTNDYVSLSNEGQEVFDEELIRKFQLWKQFRDIASIDDYFEMFGEAGMLYDIYQRCPKMDPDEWISKRSKGKVLSGRFLRGRVRYVRAEDSPYFVSLYRKQEPSSFDNSVMRKIDELGSGSIFDLERAMSESRETIKGALEVLDQNMYIVRQYTEGEDWSGLNIYQTFSVEEPKGNPAEWLVKKFLASHGPVSLPAIRGYTGLEIDEIVNILKSLDVSRIITGLSRLELYILPEDIEELREFQPMEDPMRILTLYDPLLETRWAELASRFGEGWYFPVVKDGIIVGMTEIWPLSSCIEIREIALDKPSEEMLHEFLSALKTFSSFFEFYGIDVVRIRSVFGQDVTELDERFAAVLRSAGYRLLNGMMVKGKVVDKSFQDSQIIKYVFSKQRINRSKQFTSIGAALRAMGGLRSEAEGLIRSNTGLVGKPISRSEGIFRGIGVPPFLMYMSMATAQLYRNVKDAEVAEEMASLYQVIASNPPFTKEQIFEQSPLGPSEAADALRKLYQKTLIVMDSSGKYRAVDAAEISVFEARKNIIKKSFEMFGLFSAEGLSQYLHHIFGMRDLRRALRELEAEGFLSKGYLREDNETLYWVIRSDFGKIEKAKFLEAFVLSPQDRLVTFLRDAWGIRFGEVGQFIIFEGIEVIGKFRAKIDRHDIEIWDFEGNVRANEILRAFNAKLGKGILKEDNKRLSEWEITDFFERTNLFVKD